MTTYRPLVVRLGTVLLKGLTGEQRLTGRWREPVWELGGEERNAFRTEGTSF
jgi:hypothetical protein